MKHIARKYLTECILAALRLMAIGLLLAGAGCDKFGTTRIEQHTLTQVRYAPIPAALTAPMVLPPYDKARVSPLVMDEEIARLERVIASGNARFADIAALADKIVQAAPAEPPKK